MWQYVFYQLSWEINLLILAVMISYWLNYGFFYIDVEKYGSFQWRFPIAFQAVFGFVLIVGILALPESPRCTSSLRLIPAITFANSI